jgi:hypothetical protein
VKAPSWWLVVACLLLVVGCGPREPAPPPDTGVTNPSLGIRLGSLPEDLQVAENEGDRLELVPAEPSVGGRVTFFVGEQRDAINLIAVVKQHQRWVEEQPDGEYRGGQELQTPFGTAFYSRGRYLAGVTETEQTEIYLKHPLQSRLLTISYTYPAGGDSSVRVQQLIDVLAQLEGPEAEPPQ